MRRSPLQFRKSIIRSSALVQASSSLSISRTRAWRRSSLSTKVLFSPWFSIPGLNLDTSMPHKCTHTHAHTHTQHTHTQQNLSPGSYCLFLYCEQKKKSRVDVSNSFFLMYNICEAAHDQVFIFVPPRLHIRMSGFLFFWFPSYVPRVLKEDKMFLAYFYTVTIVTKTDTDTFAQFLVFGLLVSRFVVLSASWHVRDTTKKPGRNPVCVSAPEASWKRARFSPRAHFLVWFVPFVPN